MRSWSQDNGALRLPSSSHCPALASSASVASDVLLEVPELRVSPRPSGRPPGPAGASPLANGALLVSPNPDRCLGPYEPRSYHFHKHFRWVRPPGQFKLKLRYNDPLHL